MNEVHLSFKEKVEILRSKPVGFLTADPSDVPCIETSDAKKICKHPVVSVKMITYNHEPYIRQAIEGVMMQKTDFEFELIIGEDCSQDKTREICFEYQKRYPDKIRVLWSECNVNDVDGNSVRVMARCRGDFIALCEGDDYWTDANKLQRQVDFLVSHPDYMAIGDNALTLDEMSKTERVFNDSASCDLTPDMIVSKRWVPTAGVVMRRVMLEHFNECKSRYDLVMWACIVKHGRFRYDDIKTSVYRVHSGGVTKLWNRLKWARTSRAQNREVRHLLGNAVASSIIERKIWNVYEWAARDFLASKQFLLSFATVVEGLVSSPRCGLKFLLHELKRPFVRH